MTDNKVLEGEELLAGADQSVDWTKVKVDTPILVKYRGEVRWYRRHFAKYENGRVYVYMNGGTSWAFGGNNISRVYYAKLPDDNINSVNLDKPKKTSKATRRNQRKTKICLWGIDGRLRKLNWVKQKENYYGARYLRYERSGKYLHRLDIMHKSSGDHLILSYQQGGNSDGFDNCVGLTYQDTKLVLKKYRQLKRRYKWK